MSRLNEISIRFLFSIAAISFLGTTSPRGVAAQSNAGAGVLYELGAYRDDPPGKLDNRITLVTTSAPVDSLVRSISDQADLAIMFDTDLVAALPRRPVTLRNVSAASALLSLLEGSGLKAMVSPDWQVLIVPDDRRDLFQSPTKAVKSQTVRGTITDRRSGVPLPGATVVALDTDPPLGTTANSDGEFALRNVPLGRHDFEARFLGYKPVRQTSILVGSAKEVVLTFALEEQVLTGEDIVVVPDVQKDRPVNDLANVSIRPFTVEETRRYAGGVDDPARIASAFAGVTTTGDIADNALIIRGNAPKGVQWKLEGIEIPNPNHFAGLNVAGGGGVTIFSSQLLDDSDFLTGAFPAEYGNALAGVFDMHLRRGNPQRREHTLQIGLLGIDLATEGPFGRESKVSYLINYRYSTLGLLLPLLPTEGLTTYQDLSFKTSHAIARNGRLEFWGIGGIDAQRDDATTDTLQWHYPEDRLRLRLSLGMGAAGVTYRQVLGPRSHLSAAAAVTGQSTRYRDWQAQRDETETAQIDIDSRSERVVGSVTLNHGFSSRLTSRTGASMQRLIFDLDIRAAAPSQTTLAAVAAGSGSTWLTRGFTQTRFEVSPAVQVDVGLHVQRFALTNDVSVEPRLAARVNLANGQRLYAGYGLHSQIEDLRFYFLTGSIDSDSEALQDDTNHSLKMTRANHAVVGYDVRLGTISRLRLEGYYQYLLDVPVIADSSYSLANFGQDFEFSHSLVNDGAGENYGLELTLERFLRDGYYFLATASVFRSRYRGGDGIWRNTRYDQRIAANALGGKEFEIRGGEKMFGINGRVSLTGGQLRSPIDQTASAEVLDVVMDDARAFTERDASRLVLDVTVTYRLNRRHHASVWALQVKNALAASSPYLQYDYDHGRVVELQDRVVLPVLSYKIEF